jgi:hypothetical protein
VRETSHQRAKFIEIADVVKDNIAINTYGGAGVGKSELGASAAAVGNVGVIPLDRKTRRTMAKTYAAKYADFGHKIYFPPEDFIRHAKPMEVATMNTDAAIAYYTDHKNKIMDAIYSFVERKDIDIVVIDSGTQLWEDIMFSHFGRAQRIMPRDRGPANQDIKDIMNALQEKHTIITHQASEIWKNDKPTGKFDWAGFSRMDYYCNVTVEQTFDEKTKEYGMTVRLCQDQPELIGQKILTGDDITFQMLGMTVYPEGDWA